jgi:hypothetical protein
MGMATAKKLNGRALQAKKRTKKLPATIDASTGKVEPIPRTPLKSLEHARVQIAKTCRQAIAGTLASDEASKRVYMLVQLANVIEKLDNKALEARLTELERLLALPRKLEG